MRILLLNFDAVFYMAKVIEEKNILTEINRFLQCVSKVHNGTIQLPF